MLLLSFLTRAQCLAQRADSAQSAGGFAPGARASASANATLDSVVGNRPSPVKNEVSLGGKTYRISSQGVVSGPDGHAVAGGCPFPGSVAAGQFVAGGAPAEPALLGSSGSSADDSKTESVMIGVTRQAPESDGAGGFKGHHRVRAHEQPMRDYATMNASFGPAGVYVLPRPCRVSGRDKHAMMADAAASLASAGGNVFALAGNREGVRQADHAALLPDGDVMLSLGQPTGASPKLVSETPSNDSAAGAPNTHAARMPVTGRGQ